MSLFDEALYVLPEKDVLNCQGIGLKRGY